jgi:hypothetical protein
VISLLLGLIAWQNQPVANFVMEGRFVLNASNAYECQWPGSTIRIRASGNTAKFGFRAGGSDDRWQVEIDGVPTRILKLPAGESEQTVATTKGAIVSLVRRTESFVGTTSVRVLSGAANAPISQPNRRIEIIGDSISAGFGVDGKSKDEAYSCETSNAYMTYGMIAARALKSQCSVIAWSGKKMWPDNSIPEIYDYVLPANKQHVWKCPKGKEPQVVVINLATNDFSPTIPNEAGWTRGYADFVRKVRGNYPKARIYLATGSMMSDGWPVGAKHLTTLKDYLQKVVSMVKDNNVARVDFEPQNGERDGIGSAWHPNANTQTRMASVLINAIKADLKW